MVLYPPSLFLSVAANAMVDELFSGRPFFSGWNRDVFFWRTGGSETDLPRRWAGLVFWRGTGLSIVFLIVGLSHRSAGVDALGGAVGRKRQWAKGGRAFFLAALAGAAR